jgi:hypothetical protein
MVRGFIAFLGMDLNFDWRLSRVSDSSKIQDGKFCALRSRGLVLTLAEVLD